MLKLKLQYFGHLRQRTKSLKKTLMLWKIEGRRRGRQRMRKKMVGWHHQLLELTQTHVHWVSDAIQPPHPLLSPSAFNLSQHQGLFKCQFFASDGQSIGVSASASVLPMNTQDWTPLGCTGCMSLLSKGLFKSLLQHHSSKASILWCSAFFIVQLSHPYMTPGKTIPLTRQTFVPKWYLCFLIRCLGLS